MTTFKEKSLNCPIKKEIKKAGLSLAIIFSKEDITKFGLEYGDNILLDEAVIVKKEVIENDKSKDMVN